MPSCTNTAGKCTRFFASSFTLLAIPVKSVFFIMVTIYLSTHLCTQYSITWWDFFFVREWLTEKHRGLMLQNEPPEARTLNLLIKRHEPSLSLESDEPISWSDVKRRVKHLFVAGRLLLLSVSKLVGKMLARTVP